MNMPLPAKELASRTTRISLVRHGHVANPANVYYGRLPGFALSTAGEAEAIAAGLYLSPRSVRAIYHSPLLRAQQTAVLISQQLPDKVTPQVHDDLNEVISPFDGVAYTEMASIGWDLYAHPAEPYERPADVLTRVISFFNFVQATHSGEHIVGVTHGDVVAFALTWVCGLEIKAASRQMLEPFGIAGSYPATGSVTTFSFGEEIAPDHCDLEYYSPA